MGRTDPPELAVNAKQLVFLTMIAVLAAVAAFLCGVQVGRGVAARGAEGAGPGAGAPWGAGEAAFPGAAPEGAGPAGSRSDVLSYFERLRGDGPVPEALDAVDARRSAADADPPVPSADAGGGVFVVQVMSVRGGGAAAHVKAGLEAKGYPVVVEPMRGPVALHHVRVGPYADRAEAELASRRLRTEERFRPWVTQP